MPTLLPRAARSIILVHRHGGRLQRQHAARLGFDTREIRATVKASR
jgi:hypothetical protein